MLKREKLSHIVAIALLLIAMQVIAFAEYFGLPVHKTLTDRQVFCTQEAKLCPNGSAVSRTGPNCEFAECAKTVIEQIDTSDWQTYRNEEYGFEVRYPSDFEINQSVMDAGYEGIDLDNFKHAYGHSGVLPPGGVTLNIFLSGEHSVDDATRSVTQYIDASDSIIARDDMIVDGESAKRIIVDYDFSYFVERIAYMFVQKGSHVYSITSGYRLDPQKPSDENLARFNKITATFKFIEPIDTSTWKTYRNEEYGFEVKYPAGWDYTKFTSSQFLIGFGKPAPKDLSGEYAGKFSIQIVNIAPSDMIWHQQFFDNFLQSQIIVSGVDATKTRAIWSQESIHQAKQEIQVIFEYSGKTFSLLYTFSDNQDAQLFDQILSTFKFIDKSQSSGCGPEPPASCAVGYKLSCINDKWGCR